MKKEFHSFVTTPALSVQGGLVSLMIVSDNNSLKFSIFHRLIDLIYE
jgi:hypothetical protein